MVAYLVWTSQKVGNYFANFEKVVTLLLWASQKVGGYFADFEQVEKLVIIFAILQQSYEY